MKILKEYDEITKECEHELDFVHKFEFMDIYVLTIMLLLCAIMMFLIASGIVDVSSDAELLKEIE